MLACLSCGTENAPEAKFCSECGTRLAEVAPAREARKTVTVLFCDLAGSTSLGERLDPESLRHAIERYFDRMEAVLESHGGTVEKFIGDAIMAVFGVPRLHEDDAVRAVRAAVEMREALADLNQELEHELGVSIEVRTGINTGEVMAGDRTADQRLVTGDAVNTAARLEQAAAPGEIFIGERTFDLVRDAVEAEPVDPLALKGKADAVGAYRLLTVQKGAAGHERRLDAPMIGRERQLRTLLDAFEGAVGDSTCHLFTVLGPAGIGKSRLVREFGSQVQGRAAVLTGRCLSYGEGITFWPVTEMAIQAAGIREGDPPGQARNALLRALGDAPEAEAIAIQLADLLGIDGGGPVEASWAIRRFLEAMARQLPVVAVLDDIHWAEPTLLDVIEHVADWSRDAPILLLCMARPELLEERPAWGGGKRNATSVHLEPLSEPEADVLIENLLGHPALTPEIRERIRAAAQGNPLFVEEMLGMLLDDSVLVLKDDEWVATVDLTTVQVPPAISALLAARLDRLTGDERLVLEAASVVGEVFEPEAVRALVPDAIRPQVSDLLGGLLQKDLVRPSPSDVGAREALRFRHILLRDAAYDTLPKAERASLHESFAGHLEQTLGARSSEFDEFIGYHLEHAYRLRSALGLRDNRTAAIGRKAFEHLGAAGRRAFQRGDMGAASNLLGRAVELLPPDDPDRLRIGSDLGLALTESGSIAAGTAVLQATLDGARIAGDEVSAGYAECVLWIARVIADPEVDVDEWESAADRLIDLFEGIRDPRGAAMAWMQKSYALWLRQRLEDSGAAAERAIEHAHRAGDRYIVIEMTGHLQATVGLGPRPLAEGTELMQRTLEEARAQGDRRLEQSCLKGIGMHTAWVGRIEEGGRLVDESRAIVQELGLMIEYWSSTQLTARLAMLAGDEDRAANELRQGCDELEALGETAFLSTMAGELAEIEMRRGDRTEAERWLRIAEQAAAPGDLASQTFIEVARGHLLADTDADDSARHLLAAVELVDQSDAPLWRTEVRLSAARSLDPTRREEAITLTRGARDLAEAKGLLVLVEQARELLGKLGISD